MKKIVMVIGMFAILAVGSGCFSYTVGKGSKSQIVERRMMASGKYTTEEVQTASVFGAVPLKDGVGIGVNLLTPNFWEVISERPMLQIGAAVGDAALIYGGYLAGDAIFNGDNNSNESNGGNTSGRDTVVVNGDGNTVNTSTDNSQASE